MWELDHKEGWGPKNWNFELWCWIRLFERPLTARRSDQSILKEISPEYSSERLMWKLKSNTYWFIRKDPDAGKNWRQEEKGMTEDEMVGWHHWFNDMSLSKLREMVKDREAWRAAVLRVTKSWTCLSDWTDIKYVINSIRQELIGSLLHCPVLLPFAISVELERPLAK